MYRECSRLVSCPFFQKYKDLDVKEINRLKSLFCKGPYMDQCVRKLYKELHGVDGLDHMSPEGRTLEDEEGVMPSPEDCRCAKI